MQEDPFAQPGTPSEPAPGAPSPTLTPPLPTDSAVTDAPATTAECQHVTKEVCQKSNTGLVATSVGYVLALVVIFTVLRRIWNRKATMSFGAGFLLSLTLAAGGAAALAAFDPVRGADVNCCLASGVFKAEILLQDATAGRAVLFGMLPASVLFMLVFFIERLLKRK